MAGCHDVPFLSLGKTRVSTITLKSDRMLLITMKLFGFIRLKLQMTFRNMIQEDAIFKILFLYFLY